MNKFILSMALAGGVLLSLPAQAGTVRLSTPPDYTIFGISDNGEWAVGVQGSAYSELYTFRWNLVTNEIEVSGVPSMCGTSIADDGTYCGGFNYTDETGRITIKPGYYDGTWHLLPVPEGNVTDALDGAISADGRHMALTLELNGVYRGVQYKDNELVRVLKSEDHARVYDISNDGSKTCGWTYAHIDGKTLNRTGVYWEGDSDYKIIDRNPLKPENSPWAGVRRFSADGNLAFYYGGYMLPEQQGGLPYVEAIRNFVTDEFTPIYAIDAIGQDFQLNDFSDDMKVVGSYNYQACVAEGGKTYYLTDWLKQKKGVDAKAEWTEVLNYDGTFMLSSANCIQNNGKAIGLMYNGTDMQMHAMVVRFDVELGECAPASVKVSEISKALAARIDWIMPYGIDLSKVKGYNVYRDGVKVNQSPVTGTSFYDSALEQDKEYSYQVTAIYAGGESDMSAASKIAIKGAVPEQPASFFARQKGLNSVSLTWNEPYTNHVRKYYFDDEAVSEGFGTSETGITEEAGIKFPAEEMALYGNAKITAVEFYPMSRQQDWALTIYSENAAGKLTKLAQRKITNKDNIKIGERNIINLTEPVAIPEGENIVASVSVSVVDENTMGNVIAMQTGKGTKGYSDLLRRVIVPPEQFQSFYDMSSAKGMAMQVSWKIGLVVTPEGTAGNIDNVDKYVVTRDGQEIYNGKNTSYVDAGLADGTYNYGVKAVYADGRQSGFSEASRKVVMRSDEAYGAQNVAVNSDPEKTDVTWTAPVDKDLTDITWAHGEKSDRRITATNSNFNFQAASIYPTSKLKGLNGYEIVGAKFYPTCDATYTIFIDNGTKTERVVYHEVDSFKENEWNTVYFDKPVKLDVNKTYRLIVDCYDVENEGSPLALDNNVGMDGYTALINVSTKDEMWEDISVQTGISGNWMIGLIVADPNSVQLPVKGYDVLLDGKKLNDSMLTETSYSHPTSQLGAKEGTRHKISVDTWYEPATKAVSGKPVEFIIGNVGLDETFVADMMVGCDGAILRVTNAAELAVYSLDGIKAVSAKDDSVRIDNLASGIYVVKAADADGREIVTKINIRR